jgi:hypothetical protein
VPFAFTRALDETAIDVIAAARYWRATQTQPGAPHQAIDLANKKLAAAVDAYEAVRED